MKASRLLNLEPKDFERLCLEFTRAAGWENIEYHGVKGSDKGRDIVATRRTEILPGKYISEKWIIQCKRTRALSRSDLASEVAKVAQFCFEYYLLITTATLTSSLRDSIPGLRERYRIRIVVIDGPELCRHLEEGYPDLLPRVVDEGTRVESAGERVERLIHRTRVLHGKLNPAMDRLLNEYVMLGHLARIQLLSVADQEVYVSPGDAAFHCITAGIEDPERVRQECGGYMGDDVLAEAVKTAKKAVHEIGEVQAISLDWTDTLVDEVDLDEYICEAIATVEGPPSWQAEEKLRFHKILTSLHTRADPKWYDYGYLASLMGKSKTEVLDYHDQCNRPWGLFDNAMRFLQSLDNIRKKRKIVLGLVTHCFRDILDKRAELLGVDLNLFDFIFTGDMVADLNDKEEQLQQALSATGSEPHRFLHIGDDVRRDILPAIRLGCSSILVRLTVRSLQSFWTSSMPPFSADLLDVKGVEAIQPACGFVSSYEQIIRALG